MASLFVFRYLVTQSTPNSTITITNGLDAFFNGEPSSTPTVPNITIVPTSTVTTTVITSTVLPFTSSTLTVTPTLSSSTTTPTPPTITPTTAGLNSTSTSTPVPTSTNSNTTLLPATTSTALSSTTSTSTSTSTSTVLSTSTTTVTTTVPSTTSTTTTSTTTTTTTPTTTTTTQSPCATISCNAPVGGQCIVDIDNKPFCKCKADYHGLACNETACNPNPCNGQQCSTISVNGTQEPTFLCNCSTGSWGKTCSLTDYCTSKPCVEGRGTCYNVKPGEQSANQLQYYCECNESFMNTQNGTKCVSNPCYVENEAAGALTVKCFGVGYCTSPGPDYNKILCDCNEGHLGQQCAYTDVCLLYGSALCPSNSEYCDTQKVSDQDLIFPAASQTNMSYSCVCKPGFECTPPAGVSVSTILAIIFALLFFLCVGVAVFYLVRYVRRSRKLKGQYNPAKEEMSSGNLNGSLQMQPMTKGERLI